MLRTLKKSLRGSCCQIFAQDNPRPPCYPLHKEGKEVTVAEIGEPERKVRREREDQPGVTPPQPVTVPEAVPVS